MRNSLIVSIVVLIAASHPAFAANPITNYLRVRKINKALESAGLVEALAFKRFSNKDLDPDPAKNGKRYPALKDDLLAFQLKAVELAKSARKIAETGNTISFYSKNQLLGTLTTGGSVSEAGRQGSATLTMMRDGKARTLSFDYNRPILGSGIKITTKKRAFSGNEVTRSECSEAKQIGGAWFAKYVSGTLTLGNKVINYTVSSHGVVQR